MECQLCHARPALEAQQKSRVLADTQPKIVMNALAKQPFGDFTAEQKRYKITLRVTLARDQAPTPCKATEKKRIQLMSLSGIGPAIAAVMTREVYHRQFDNRRQVAGFLGLATSPHDSGDVERSQGIREPGEAKCAGP